MNNTKKLVRICCLIGIAIIAGCAITGIHCLLYFGYDWAALAILCGIAAVIKLVDKKGSFERQRENNGHF